MCYKIIATGLQEAKCEAHEEWSINYVCSNVIYCSLEKIRHKKISSDAMSDEN